jgi:predicted RNA-binding Zn-ribbon protein involved in translation (DUF1610 family)
MFKDPVPHNELIKMVYVGRNEIPDSHHLYVYTFKCPICGKVDFYGLREEYGIEQWARQTMFICPKCGKRPDMEHDVWKFYYELPCGLDDDTYLCRCPKCEIMFTPYKPRRDWQYYNWMKKYLEWYYAGKVREAQLCWYWEPDDLLKQKVQFT